MKTAKERKPLSKKKKVVIFSLLTALPIAAGIGTGVIITTFFLRETSNYNFNVEEDDITATMEKYQRCIDEKIPFEEGLKPYEAVNAAYYRYSQHETSKSYSYGTVTAAIVNQTIRTCTIKDHDKIMEESLSKSDLVGVAARTYADESDTIKFYRGDIQTRIRAKWSEPHYNYTSEEYTTDFGKTPKEPCIYVISKSTVISKQCSIIREDNDFIVNITLNPTRGVVKYVKQMKSLSELGDYPIFDSCQLSFLLDETLLIKKVDINESYYAKTSAGVGADSKATMTITYEVDGTYSIPDINTDVAYPEGF